MTLAKTEKKRKEKKECATGLVPSRLRLRGVGLGDGKGKGRKTLAFPLPIAPVAPLRRDRERRLGMSQLTK